MTQLLSRDRVFFKFMDKSSTLPSCNLFQLSFVLRAIQGVGCAATDTAVFAIASSRFKKRLGKVYNLHTILVFKILKY